MIRKLARYTIKPGTEDKVETAIREFLAAVARNEPQTTYESYRIDKGTSFVHFMAFQDEASEQRHRTSEHTKTFVEALYPNCQEPPSFSDLESIR